MIGKPKFLNTKQDYLNFLAMTEADGVTNAEKKQALEDLRDGAKDWYAVGDVDKDNGIVDETHKVIVNNDMDGNTTYTQYEYRLNPTARVFQVGFTLEEVESLIAQYQ